MACLYVNKSVGSLEEVLTLKKNSFSTAGTPALNSLKLKGSKKTPATNYYENPSLQPLITPLILKQTKDQAQKPEKLKRKQKSVAKNLDFDDESVTSSIPTSSCSDEPQEDVCEVDKEHLKGIPPFQQDLTNQ
jgi:hypothetical protein